MYNKDFTYPAGSVGFDAATSRYDPSMHVQAKQINGSPVAFVFGVADIVGKSSFVPLGKKTARPKGETAVFDPPYLRRQTSWVLQGFFGVQFTW